MRTGLYGTNVKNNYVYDMYDDLHGTTGDSVTLCYADLDTIHLMAAIDPRWDKVFKTMQDIVSGGYISDAFPLYKGSFSYTSKEYSDGDISMVQSALTVLSLARIGECPKRTLDYLKGCIKSGGDLWHVPPGRYPRRRHGIHGGIRDLRDDRRSGSG